MSGRVWATSDWHLGHAIERIGRYEPSRRISAPEWGVHGFEDELIRNYEAAVLPSDTVWFLGDMVMGPSAWVERIAALPGTKLLVLGNHDRGRSVSQWYLRAGFTAVVPLYAWHLRRDGTPMLLSHFPALRSARDDRYLAERVQLAQILKSRKGSVNVHGHTHSWEHPDRARFMNVCPEVRDYQPVLLETNHE